MIEKLRQLGLNEYEAKSYIALVQHGAQTGREVAKRSKVPPTRVFDTLRSLEAKALVSLVTKKPMVWKAISPEKGLNGFVDMKLSLFHGLSTSIAQSLMELQPSKAPDIHERITVVKGYEQMFILINSYLRNAKKEYNILSVGEDIPYSHELECRRAIGRGVAIRLVASRSDSTNQHILKKRKREGWIARHSPASQDWSFAVIDKEVVLINVRNPEEREERITIFFENPGFAGAMQGYFKQVFDKAKPL